MAKATFNSIDEYIAAKPEIVQTVLQRVRNTIRKAIPEGVETISYQIPAYKLHGRVVVYFAGWNEHFSLYPAIGGLVEAFKHDLAPYTVTKGTIRFPLSQPVPIKLIERIVKFRADAVAGRRQPSKAWEKSSPELIALFEELVPQGEGIQRKQMFGCPCCFLNGNLFAGLHQETVVFRLSDADLAAFLKLKGAARFEPMAGRKMKSYGIWTAPLKRERTVLSHWLGRSLDFAHSLPPKKPAKPKTR